MPKSDAYQYELNGQSFTTNDAIISGRDIRANAGLTPASDHILIEIGHLTSRSVGLEEAFNLDTSNNPALRSFPGDRAYSFTINERGYEWGSDEISVSDIRLIAQIPEDHALYLEKQNRPDKELSENDHVKIGAKGVERLTSSAKSWKLNVQGVLLTLTAPLITVRDALVQAGFDPNVNWIAILKRKGEVKLQVALTDQIDLRLPGIEKLRLTPGQINNGEAQSAPRRSFRLLDKDEIYLQQRGITWETFEEGGRRWLLLHNFVLPKGYNHAAVDIAIDVPLAYPRAEIDMFHCLPHLTLKAGETIGETSGRTAIQGQTYQQWSRHLNGQTRWDPVTDSVMTHIAVIEAALLKEVGE